MKQSISITLDGDCAHDARVEAAKMGMSRSRLINRLLAHFLDSNELREILSKEHKLNQAIKLGQGEKNG